ncbi:MAG: class I SAM-dependent methyltransferase [Candidatus Acidiferrales bacterium]
MGKTRQAMAANASSGSSAPVAAAPKPAELNVRVSNGLKEFLWLLSDVQKGHLLDLGPIWQSTVGFFAQRRFRIYSEDLLRAWKDFRAQKEREAREAGATDLSAAMKPEALAGHFLEYALAYPPENFDAVLAWDIFDYLDGELMSRVIRRLYELLAPRGAMLTIFHSKPAERFHRYRIADYQSIEMLPGPQLFAQERIFKNSEILTSFSQFRSSKTFVGRDQLREGLFLK